MQISASQGEIKELIDSFLGRELSTIYDKSITFTDILICNYKVPVMGSVMIEIEVTAIDGTLDLNIVKASIAGMSIFGAIRKKAGDLILSELAPYSKYISIRKDKQGNLRLSVNGVQFTDASISNGNVYLNFQFA